MVRDRTASASRTPGPEKGAAQRLGLSHSTVKHHLANARSKVGAATTAQLVWILAPRLPDPEDVALSGQSRTVRRGRRSKRASGHPGIQLRKRHRRRDRSTSRAGATFPGQNRTIGTRAVKSTSRSSY
jgi:hypothetical protein